MPLALREHHLLQWKLHGTEGSILLCSRYSSLGKMLFRNTIFSFVCYERSIYYMCEFLFIIPNTNLAGHIVLNWNTVWTLCADTAPKETPTLLYSTPAEYNLDCCECAIFFLLSLSLPSDIKQKKEKKKKVRNKNFYRTQFPGPLDSSYPKISHSWRFFCLFCCDLAIQHLLLEMYHFSCCARMGY